MHGVGHDRRSRPQQPARVLVEDVGLPTDLVHRPTHIGGSPLGADPRFPALEHARAPDHVVHHEPPADRVTSLVFGAGPRRRHVVDLADLDGFHVPVLGEAGRDALDLAPPVGRVPLHEHLGQADDEVGFARRPDDVVVEFQGWRHVRRITLRGAGAVPRVDRCDFPVVERHVVLEVLDADVLLDVPRRHGARSIADLGAFGDSARVAAGIAVGDERHRSHAVVPVTADAGALEDGRDVTAEGHVLQHRSARRRCRALCRERRRRDERHDDAGRRTGQRRTDCRDRPSARHVPSASMSGAPSPPPPPSHAGLAIPTRDCGSNCHGRSCLTVRRSRQPAVRSPRAWSGRRSGRGGSRRRCRWSTHRSAGASSGSSRHPPAPPSRSRAG